MKLLLENWKKFINENQELSFLPDEILRGEEEFDEYEGEEGVLVKNIPMTSLSMTVSQGEQILTEGLPVLYYNTSEQQLIVEDGNHRIFQKWLKGEDSFDAYVYSSAWHGHLRHVYDGEEKFDWNEEYRK